MSDRTTARRWLSAATLGITIVASLIASTTPASAAAIVYETQHVTALQPGADPSTVQQASIDVPTGYDRYRRSWHRVEWVEAVPRRPIDIMLDLEPRRSTQRALRREADRLAASGYDYTELKLDMYEPGGRLLARWVFTLKDPGTSGPRAFVTVYLTGGHDRLSVAGWDTDRDLAKQVRHHVLRSLVTS